MEAFALEVGGRVVGSGLLGASLELELGSRPLWFTLYSTGGKMPTLYWQAKLELSRQVPVDLSLEDRTARSALLALFSRKIVQTGDEAFDRRFLVRASDPSLALSLLSPHVRGILTEMAGEPPSTLLPGVQLGLKPGSLVLLQKLPGEPALPSLRAFYRACSPILHRVQSMGLVFQ